MEALQGFWKNPWLLSQKARARAGRSMAPRICRRILRDSDRGAMALVRFAGSDSAGEGPPAITRPLPLERASR